LILNTDLLLTELTFKAVRSSGAGGQHVNKVSSKIMLFFNVLESKILNEDEKELLLKKLSTKLTKDYILILNCDESRSQHKNKEIVIKRFNDLINKGLFVPKTRKPTKISRTRLKKRKEDKQKHSQKKDQRKKPDLE